MKKPPKQDKKIKGLGVHFDLEENAEDLFRQAVESIDPSKVEHTAPPERIDSKARGKNLGSTTYTIDLHGLNLAEAKDLVKNSLAGYLRQTRDLIEVTVITGKGRHSPDGKGTLVHEIYGFVKQSFAQEIVNIDSSPGDLLLEGFPIRGHFKVTLRAKRG